MNQIFRRLLLAVAIFLGPLGLTACPALIPALPTIAAVITDALVIMNVIDGAVADFFRQHPSTPEKLQRNYREVFTRAMNALNAAQHALEGQKDIDQKDYDAAFAEFKAAFLELKALLEKEGLMQNGMLKAGEGSVMVPEPDALTFRVK